MKVSFREYRPGRWVVTTWFNNQKVQKYSNKENEVLEGRQQAIRAAAVMAEEIKNKTFNPDEWAKDQPFLLKNAFSNFQETKQCQIERKAGRKSLYQNHIGPLLGKMDLRKIATVHINSFHGELIAKGLDDSTIRNILALVKSILRYNGEGWMIRWPKIQIQKKPIRWLTQEQQVIALRYIPEFDQPIFQFLARCGVRPSEACAFQREDINWQEGKMYIRKSMGMKGRVIPYTKNRLKRIIPISRLTDPSILKPKFVTPFVFTRNAIPYQRKTLHRIWARAIRRANQEHGIPIVKLNQAFRHSLACQALNAGVKIEAIQAILGHTSVITTQQSYAEMLPDTAWDQLKVLDYDRITEKGAASKPTKE